MASKMHMWRASGKGMGLHTGPSQRGWNASWEVAQALRPGVCAGEGPAHFPSGGNVMGQGLLFLVSWFPSLGPQCI